jgi:hypothetical protein
MQKKLTGIPVSFFCADLNGGNCVYTPVTPASSHSPTVVWPSPKSNARTVRRPSTQNVPARSAPRLETGCKSAPATCTRTSARSTVSVKSAVGKRVSTVSCQPPALPDRSVHGPSSSGRSPTSSSSGCGSRPGRSGPDAVSPLAAPESPPLRRQSKNPANG